MNTPQHHTLSHNLLLALLYLLNLFNFCHLSISLHHLFFLNSFLHDRIHHSIPQLDSPLDSQVVIKCVTVAMLHFKLLPYGPESRLILAWIAKLTQMCVYGPSALDLVELPFKFSKPQSSLDEYLPRCDPFKSSFIHFTSAAYAVELSCLSYVQVEHMEQFRALIYLLCGPIVDGHGVGEQAKVLFVISEHEEEKATLVLRTVFEHLIEQVTDALDLTASQSLNDLGQVIDPKIIHVWPLEQLYCSLIYFKAFFVEVIRLEEPCAIHNSLWSGNFEV